MTNLLPLREEIPEKYRWDIESIFATEALWEEGIAMVEDLLEQIATFPGRLTESSATLAQYLHLQDKVMCLGRKVFVYASLQASVEMHNQTAVARVDRMRGLMARVHGGIAFAKPEIAEAGRAQIDQMITDSTDVAVYQHFFERLFDEADYTRSAEVEAVLAMAGGVFSTMQATHSVLANADLDFAPAVGSDGTTHPVAQGSIHKLVASPDRAMRRSSYENYADSHLAYKSTMANALTAGIKRNVFLSKVRGYASALEASMKRDFIPIPVFHNLIDIFKKNLPTWHRYWRTRRQALGLDTLWEYDIKAPLNDTPPHVSYEQAVDWIAEGMRPLGDEYVSVLRRGATVERWVDVMPNHGKRMGAFSSGGAGNHPFIMMSFNPNLFGMSTLAHELGHSMHSYFTWRTQKQMVFTGYGLFAAEVASNFNQALVRSYLFDTQPDHGFQISLLEETMANFHRYFFIMPTLARFELAVHERVEQGKSLNADYLIKLMADLFREGYGDELDIDVERVGITWAEFHTHLYSNFYVYKYATGISAAHALLEPIKAQDETAVANYLGFLHAGGSDYPIEILKRAGVDMNTPEPVEKAFAILSGHVDRLANLVSDDSPN